MAKGIRCDISQGSHLSAMGEYRNGLMVWFLEFLGGECDTESTLPAFLYWKEAHEMTNYRHCFFDFYIKNV